MDLDISKLFQRQIHLKNMNILERQRSCEEKELFPLHRPVNNAPEAPASNPLLMDEGWEALNRALVYFDGKPVGTIAALDDSKENLNYNQVFVRDFVPSALAFLMKKKHHLIVKNFILKTLYLQSWEKKVDKFELGAGVMPASL
ncbi:hypothetical protein QN277_001607 [Acacia crassicarpa]|uniref:Uncharacterized protein n=1 Tax=Acacia crassicarpa TaxID=499986 RepID=A0AAE1TIJ4_9FABA|nr:hypothetical protein QN277_001607 [Acacia crassicarpa]